MKIIKEQDGLKICYDGKKYTVCYDEQILLTYLRGKSTFIDENLVIVDEDIINVYQNIRQGLFSTSIICKQGVVIARPMLFNELIIVVFRGGIVQYDTNLNIINKNGKIEHIIYDIEKNYIIQQRGKYNKILLRS